MAGNCNQPEGAGAEGWSASSRCLSSALVSTSTLTVRSRAASSSFRSALSGVGLGLDLRDPPLGLDPL
jgi:hypothetical protein